MEKRNKVLLILGASSDLSIGLLEQSSEDYDTILAHFNHTNDKLMEQKNKLGNKLILFQADFSKETEVENMICDIKETGLTVTHIVHFVSPKCSPTKFLKDKWEKFDIGFKVSVKTFDMILKAFIPQMAKQKYGKIVTLLTSCTHNNPPKYLTSYVTVKYALLGMMKSLAVEYANKGLCINSVSPDMIDTKFIEDYPDLVKQQTAMNSPISRMLEVGDVVGSIMFLLSENANCINGQNLIIDSGK